MGDEKSNINIVVIGEIDSGKSTTIGHLVFKTGGIDNRSLNKFEKDAEKIGKSFCKYAWVLDNLKEEREQGLTMEITRLDFVTPKLKITITDTPGHKNFVKNMVTGVSKADCAILIISARKNDFESAMSGQTPEHLILVNHLDIRQIIVCVNKMDSTDPPYSQIRFDNIKRKLSTFMENVGFNTETIPFIPISGWFGDNLYGRSENYGWFEGWNKTLGENTTTGFTMFDAINNIEPPTSANDKPLRIPIKKIYKKDKVFTGRIESGILRKGNKVIFASSNVGGKVVSIQIDHTPCEEASAGNQVGFKVQGVKFIDDIGLYALCGDDNDPPKRATEFKAHVWMLDATSKIKVGYTPVVNCHTARVPCKFGELLEKIDPRTGLVTEIAPQQLAAGDSAIINCIPTQSMSVETYVDYPALGRFNISDSEKTVGVGIIKSVKKGYDRNELERSCALLKRIPSWDEVINLLDDLEDWTVKNKSHGVRAGGDWPKLTCHHLSGLSDAFLKQFGIEIKDKAKNSIQTLLRAKETYATIIKVGKNAKVKFEEFFVQIEFSKLQGNMEMPYLIEQMRRMKRVMFRFKELLRAMNIVPGLLIENRLAEIKDGSESLKSRIDSMKYDVVLLMALEGRENLNDFIQGKGIRIHLVARIVKALLDLEAQLTGGLVVQEAEEISGSLSQILEIFYGAIES